MTVVLIKVLYKCLLGILRQMQSPYRVSCTGIHWLKNHDLKERERETERERERNNSNIPLQF